MKTILPSARTVDLVVSETDDEVLVYDQDVAHLHQLNRAAAGIWRLCDGHRSPLPSP